ncbi:MAG TPA: AAA family ATPase, partial [Pseudonocardiaceae bacterium]|nr:AAA family ATPase [Pseudonocardiaceae bacterium]
MFDCRSQSRLIGRDADLNRLAQIWLAVRQGRPSAVLLSGESGVGKTRLVQELAVQAADEGAIVLVGTAIDLGAEPPCWPVVSALRSFLRPSGRQWARDLLRPWLPELIRLLEPLHPDQTLRQLEDRSRPLELVCRVVAELATRAPVLLVIEDLHWAGRSTRDLLTYLLASLTEEAVLAVGTFQTDAVGPGHPLRSLLAALRRHRRVYLHDVRPLTRDTVASIVGACIPGDEVLVDLVWQRSEGNAFIVEQTLRAAQEGNASAVPLTLRELVLDRVAGLPSAARRVTRVLALGEGAVEHRLLARIVDLPEAELLAALRAAVDAAVIVVDPVADGYKLRHGLMKDVLATDLLPGERIELHRRYGAALGQLAPACDPAVTVSLAHHWYLAGEVDKALSATVSAAQAAERMRGFAEAHRQWLRALELIECRHLSEPAEFTRAELGERAAETAHLAGEHDQAVAVLRKCLQTCADPGGLRTAMLTAQLGRYLLAGGRSAEAVQAYQRATALMPTGASGQQRSLVLGGLAQALLQTGHFSASRRYAGHALVLAQQAGALPEQAQVLATLGFSLGYLENPDAGLAALAESLRIAELTSRPTAVGQAYQHWAELLSGPLNELAEGVEVARQGVGRMAALGLSRTVGVKLLAMAANGLFRLGRWDEAAAAIEQAWALRPLGAESLEVRLARCRLLIGRGHFDAAEQDLEVVETLSTTTVGPRYRVPLLTLRAGLQMWQGHPEVARRLVREGLAVVEQAADDLWLLAPLVWHGLRAEAEVATHIPGRRTDDLDKLREQMQNLAVRGAAAVPAVRASVRAYLDLCEAEESRATGHSAPKLWARAAATWEGHRHPYPAAYARLRQAEALFVRGSRSATAAQALHAAYRTARALDARPFLAEITDLAARAHIHLVDTADPDHSPLQALRPGRRTRWADVAVPELAELTAREFEVLTELAKGLTNREIAERLFISEKTVSVHVSHILAKIGARTRVQASAILYRVRSLHPELDVAPVGADGPGRSRGTARQ